MMKIIGIIVAVVVALALVVIIFLGYMGMFGKPEVTIKAMGPYTLVYETFVGPYQETGKLFDQVYQDLKQVGIETTNGIGIYYDDPRQVDKNQLRSDCGSVINEVDLPKLAALNDKYKTKVLNKRDSLVADFPIRNNLSYMLGPIKAYPALMQAAKERNLTLDTPYEFYDMTAKIIYYVAPVKE